MDHGSGAETCAVRRVGASVAFLAGTVAGALGTYLFEPRHGRRRRRLIRDRAAGALRRSERRSSRALRAASARAHGRWRGFVHRLRPGPARELDDAELVHKVESIVFRDPRRPKGRISLNAEHGCVVLRGEVDSAELLGDLERAVREVQGVRDVENLLHLPGQPVPDRRAGGSPR
ncbi:MAG TPA: BON domain-containing protein [Gaiellaceae bacterium]|nr:BON domain-containing protein [Gaiellaceae bacterium]